MRRSLNELSEGGRARGRRRCSSFGACSSNPPAGSAAPGGSGGAATQPEACKNKKGTSTTEIHVYSSLPRQGTNTEQTDTLVEQIKATLDGKKVGDFTIKYFDLDDSSAAKNGDWDGAVEQANANKAANDPDAMVYIGTYNSGAAKISIPILNAGLPRHGQPGQHLPGPDQGGRRRHRAGRAGARYYPAGTATTPASSTTDDAQGARRRRVGEDPGKTKAYVLDDTQVYGQGLARVVGPRRVKIGVTVVSANGTSESFDAKATDYAPCPEDQGAGADIIYIGSITGQNTGKLWKDIRAAMPDITIMAGDGVFEKSWYDGAGAAGNGTYLTFGGVGPDQLTGARQDLVREVQGRSRRHAASGLHRVRQRRSHVVSTP